MFQVCCNAASDFCPFYLLSKSVNLCVKEDQQIAIIIVHPLAGWNLSNFQNGLEKFLLIKRNSRSLNLNYRWLYFTHFIRRSNPETFDTYEDMKRKLGKITLIQEKIVPMKSISFDRPSSKNESIASFAIRLRNLSKYCGFHNVDDEISREQPIDTHHFKF